MVPVQDSYMQNRAEALQNVESTIVELSNIFSQLATMVAQQGEIAIRYIIIILFVLLKVKWPLFINIFQHFILNDCYLIPFPLSTFFSARLNNKHVQIHFSYLVTCIWSVGVFNIMKDNVAVFLTMSFLLNAIGKW